MATRSIGAYFWMYSRLQAQWTKLVLRQFAGEKAPRLVAKLRDALGDEAMVMGVVSIHSWAPDGHSVPARPYMQKECLAIR
jgi:hypothetical protein